MILHILRALFILLMAAAGWFYVNDPLQPRANEYNWYALSITLAIGVLFVCIDILAPRQKVLVFSGTFLGLLVGMLITYGLSYVVSLILDVVTPVSADQKIKLLRFITLIVGILCCYLSISFVLQTKDDFRFIVPYVEFAKQVRGARPLVVDTSVIIDGRILDLVETGLVDSRLIVPRFVVLELQLIADNGEKLKRNRGRRGLDILTKLQGNKKAEVIIYDWTGHGSPEAATDTDQKLLVLAKELNGRVLTNDSNLSKVAQVRGVDVINMNEVANALRPVVLPGEKLAVRLVKPGEDPSQGIGFLEDGTMVVVKDGRGHIGEEVDFAVTNVLQTATGRMIFGQIGDGGMGRRPQPQQQQPRQRSDAPSART
jgi:uncharacterized protein YacL